MREGISDPPRRNPRIVWSGAVLIVMGLSILLLVGEWFAAFDSCLVNPTCYARIPSSNLEAFGSLMV